MNYNVGSCPHITGWFDVEESNYKWHRESHTGTALKFY
jgi:hypothetical protein